MDNRAILTVLRQNEAALRAQGVTRAASSGSRARDDARSDIDIVAELDPLAELALFDHGGIKVTVAELFDEPASVVDRATFRASMRSNVFSDALYAF